MDLDKQPTMDTAWRNGWWVKSVEGVHLPPWPTASAALSRICDWYFVDVAETGGGR